MCGASDFPVRWRGRFQTRAAGRAEPGAVCSVPSAHSATSRCLLCTAVLGRLREGRIPGRSTGEKNSTVVSPFSQAAGECNSG